MKIFSKDKTHSLCKSCQNCEFYKVYSDGIWCDFPPEEISYFNNKRVRSIKSNDIFKYKNSIFIC